MKVIVTVVPKKGLLDPQGSAVGQALTALGFQGVRKARVGKVIELDLEASDSAELRARIDAVCSGLLSNPVIEDYSYQVLS